MKEYNEYTVWVKVIQAICWTVVVCYAIVYGSWTFLEYNKESSVKVIYVPTEGASF